MVSDGVFELDRLKDPPHEQLPSSSNSFARCYPDSTGLDPRHTRHDQSWLFFQVQAPMVKFEVMLLFDILRSDMSCNVSLL